MAISSDYCIVNRIGESVDDIEGAAHDLTSIADQIKGDLHDAIELASQSREAISAGESHQEFVGDIEITASEIQGKIEDWHKNSWKENDNWFLTATDFRPNRESAEKLLLDILETMKQIQGNVAELPCIDSPF